MKESNWKTGLKHIESNYGSSHNSELEEFTETLNMYKESEIVSLKHQANATPRGSTSSSQIKVFSTLIHYRYRE